MKLNQLVRVNLEHSIDYGLTLKKTREICRLNNIVSYCFTIIDRSFRMTLLFTQDNITKHYTPRTFKDLFQAKQDTIMEDAPLPEALSLPTREDAASSKRSALMKLFDNEAEDPNDRFNDFDPIWEQ